MGVLLASASTAYTWYIDINTGKTLIYIKINIKNSEMAKKSDFWYFYITTGRTTKMNKTTDNKCWKCAGKKELCFTADEIANQFQHFGNQCRESSKCYKQIFPYAPNKTTPWHMTKGLCHSIPWIFTHPCSFFLYLQ